MTGMTASSFKPEYIELARQMAFQGATDREIAEALEVCERTVHRWKHAHPEFGDALVVGKAAADERVVQSLYRRAVGYSFDAIKFNFHEGEVTQTAYVEHVPPDVAACRFWLQNRRADEWRERTEVVGNPLNDLAARLDAACKRVGD